MPEIDCLPDGDRGGAPQIRFRVKVLRQRCF
jgi:hypothetical protein